MIGVPNLRGARLVAAARSWRHGGVRVPFRLSLALLLLPLPVVAQTKPDNTHALERMVVTGKRPSATDAGVAGIRTYDESEIEASGSFTLQEFIEQLPRGSGDEQLILVNGVPMDLADLTPAMVAAIEVSYTGVMPDYGAFSRGRIINIRLKQDYEGREARVDQGGSVQGDAWRSMLSLSGGVIRGPWRLTWSVEYNRQEALTADARDYSREQDHRAQGGRDFRTPWGEVAVVQAVAGNLNGVFSSTGSPVPVALVPENAVGPLLPGQFIAGTGVAASGQRFFNTSPYLYLSSPSESPGGRIALNRSFGKLQLGLSVNYRQSRSRRDGPPPVSAASAATVVPAAFNPFGQDVMVGLVHTGFGPVAQATENRNARLILSANWTAKNNWRINGNLMHGRMNSESDTRDLDPAAFTAALAAANPAVRFNPFLGAGSQANAVLYPALAVNRTQDRVNRSTSFYAQANGPVAKGWGAGPVQLSFNANAGWRDDERTTRNLRGTADGTTRNYDANYTLGGNVNVPLLKDRPRAHRLEGFGYTWLSSSHGGGGTDRGGVGFFWAPVRAWSVRANLGRSLSRPGELGYDEPVAIVMTLMDPRRTPASVENVEVISRRTATTQSSRSDDFGVAMTFEPPAKPGLQFNVEYAQQTSSRATGPLFSPQDVIDNEALFAGRVVREAPTAADLALGQPGRILTVDTTAAAVASDRRGTLNFGVEYQFSPGAANQPRGPGPAAARNAGALPPGAPGQPRSAQQNRFSFGLNVEYPITSRYEVAEGQAFVSREEGPGNRPEWSATGRVRWSNRQWNVGLQLRHSATSRLGTIPAYTNMGLDASYRIEKAFWGRVGKGMRLRLSAQHLGGNTPPYADTLLGYRGGSAAGTMLAFSVNTPW